MGDDLTLDQILDGTEEAEPETEAAESEEPKGDEEGSTPEPEESKSETEEQQQETEQKQEATEHKEEDSNDWKYAAYKDERAKRQELERRLQELESKIPKVEESEKPNAYDDPEAALKYQNDKFERARLEDKLDLSRSMMLELKDDYQDREDEFVEIAKADPDLGKKMLQSSNPAKFAYDHVGKVRQQKELESIGSIDDFKAKLRAEIMAELKQKPAENVEQKPKTKLISGLASEGSESISPFTEESLSEVLNAKY